MTVEIEQLDPTQVILFAETFDRVECKRLPHECDESGVVRETLGDHLLGKRIAANGVAATLPLRRPARAPALPSAS